MKTHKLIFAALLALAGSAQASGPPSLERVCLDGVRVALIAILGLDIVGDEAISRTVVILLDSATPNNDAVSRTVVTQIAQDTRGREAISRAVVAQHDPNSTIDTLSRVVSVLPYADHSGHIVFSDLADPGSTAPLTATVSIWDPIEGTAPVDYPVSLDSSGNFTITGLRGKWSVLSVKEGTWLRKNVAHVLGAPGCEIVLKNGDIDGDNEVGPGDFGMLSSAFGSVDGDSNWEPNADLDRDGEVGPSDFGILSANFGEAGDELP